MKSRIWFVKESKFIVDVQTKGPRLTEGASGIFGSSEALGRFVPSEVTERGDIVVGDELSSAESSRGLTLVLSDPN